MNNNKIQGSHRRLMGIPVPWVFVIVYLAGVGIEQIFPITIGPGDFLTIGRLLSILSLAVGAFLAIMGAQWLFRKVHTTTDPNQVSSSVGNFGAPTASVATRCTRACFWSLLVFQVFSAFSGLSFSCSSYLAIISIGS